MKKSIKLFATFILCAIFALTYVCSAFAELIGPISLAPITGDANSYTIAFSGRLTSDGGQSYVLNLSRQQEGEIVFSLSNLPLASAILQTDSGGYIDEEIRLSRKVFASGYYNLSFYSEALSEVLVLPLYIPSYTIAPSDMSDVEALLAILNSAESENTYITQLVTLNKARLILGFDFDFSSSGEFVSAYAYHKKGSAPYEAYKLQNKLIEGDTAYRLKTNGVSDAKINTGLLGESYSEYSTLSSAEKARLDQVLKDGNYFTKALDVIFAEKLIVAKVTAHKNINKLSSAIKAYASNMGLTMETDDYKKIPAEQKYKVYDLMLKDFDTLTSYENIITSFNKASKSVADTIGSSSDTEPARPSQSTGSGASSSQSSGSNVLSPSEAEELVPQRPKPIAIFSDIDNHFAKSHIEKLAAKGIISGYEDGSFKPYNYITRAEFAKLISSAFDINTNGSSEFSDVGSEWFAPYVKSLADENIITGYMGYFKPLDNIKREDAMLILSRICQRFDISSDNISSMQYADSAEISTYAKEATELLTSLGIINGDGGYIKPLHSISRGEAATALSKLYDLYEQKEAAGK